MDSELFYAGPTELGAFEWQEIVHALITYGRRIWLPASVEVGDIVGEDARTVVTTLEELKACGAIAGWVYEGTESEIPRAGRVITEGEQENLHELITEEMMRRGQSPLLSTLQEITSGRNIERTSRIIEFRHELMSMGVAHLVGADGLVYGRRTGRMVPPSDFYRYELLTKRYTATLFRKFRIPSLLRLRTEDVLELQKRSEALRGKLDAMMRSTLTELPDKKSVIEERCQDLYGSYLETVRELVRGRSGSRFVRDTTEDLVIEATGLVVPAMGLMSIARRLGLWLRDRHHLAFVLYMSELQTRTSRSFVAV